jgi:hypothetical protein
VTYVWLVCLFVCLNLCSFYILFIFKLVKSFFVQNTRKKNEKFLYDLDGNHCEIIF